MAGPRLHIHRLLLLLACAGWIAAAAQPFRRGFELLTMAQGLSSNEVTALLVDNKGYLWASTTNGLNRYDGYGFVSYKFDPQDPHSLDQDLVFALFEDRDSVLWVGTAEGGISRLDAATGKFTEYKPEQPARRLEPVLRAVSAINQDREGYFWISSHSGELRRFDKRTGRFSAFDYDLAYHPQPGDIRPFDNVNCICRDRHNDLWIGNKSGLHQLVLGPGAPFDKTGATFRHFVHDPADTNSLAGVEVDAVFEDHAGCLWVNTDQGLDMLDRKTGRFRHYRHDPANPRSSGGKGAGDIVEDGEDYLWIVTAGGIDRLDPGRSVFEHFYSDPEDHYGLANAWQQRLAVDKQGNIWLGGAGIQKFDPYQTPFAWFHHYPRDARTMDAGPTRGVCEDRAGNIWCTTQTGLDRLDKSSGVFRHIRLDARNAEGRTFARSAVITDDEGQLWVTSWSGTVDRLDPVTGHCTQYIGPRGRFPNADRRIYNSLCIDHTGTVWIGEASSGVTELNYKMGTIRHYGHDPNDPDGISDYQANCICEDNQGFIWIGHGSVATDRLDPRTGKIRHYQYHYGDTDGISSNAVRSMVCDRHGDLWMGTWGGGLCEFHSATGKFSTYTEKNGLSDNNINSIVADDDGNLWLGTGKGVCRFSPRKKEFTPVEFLRPSLVDQAVRFYFKDRDGLLYFSDQDEGLKVFDPARVWPNPYVPPVVVTRFRVFDQERVIGKTVTLPYRQNFFSAEFSALSYTDAVRNQYAYQLEGVDKDWVFCGTRRTATYTDLNPGTYIFHVRGSNNSGVWNKTGATLVIVIDPPWWRTTWAYAVYAVCGLAALWIIYRLQRKRLIEKERERGRARELEMQALRAQMNPHFIFNCLTSINKFILKNEMSAASDYLTKFSRLIRLVLNNSKLPLIPLEDELEMLRLYLDMEKLRFKTAFDYYFDIPSTLDTAGILVPPLLLQPFAENAIWHGLMHKKGPGRLDIRLEESNRFLVCSITDDGVGRKFAETAGSKSAQTHKSLGVDITRQRLALADANEEAPDSLVIEDLTDERGNPMGTRVLVRLRMRTERDKIKT